MTKRCTKWKTRLENLNNKRAYLPADTEQRLVQEAQRQGLPVYALIREAIEQYLLDPNSGKGVKK